MKIFALVLMLGIAGCKKSGFDMEPRTKERGSSVESSFMSLEQLRKEYGGEEATFELIFSPAESLQTLREPMSVQAGLSRLNSDPVFHEVPYSMARRLLAELNKIENYGGPYGCAFHEDFVLRLHGQTKDLLFHVCTGCGEFEMTFDKQPLARVTKLSYSPELSKVLNEIFALTKKN